VGKRRHQDQLEGVVADLEQQLEPQPAGLPQRTNQRQLQTPYQDAQSLY